MGLFKEHCAKCHGEGVIGQDPGHPEGGPTDDGRYLAPALDQKGHLWTYPPELLFQKIRTGLLDVESDMPKCKGTLTDEEITQIIRYVIKNQLFVEQLATNSTYFKDPRLIDIFAYIKENLDGDLSNKKLASVANVSEDYVGQYFKMLTGINPQDYIEYQRMERAVSLLRTTKKSIREIGTDVGYKDTAYFCRRFKMMFGIPAGKMRRRESLMNV